MSNYDPYEREYTRRYVREERRAEREPAYLDPREHLRPYPSRDLVPRAREGSDLSIEEVRRDFPPPSGRDVRRARSAEPDYYDDDYDYRRGYDRRDDRRPTPRRSPGSTYIEEEERRTKSKGMSKEEKIMAAVAGAALLVGGKELYDRREAKGSGSKVQRNALSSAALAGVGALAAYQGAEFYSKQQAKKDQKATYILHRGRDGHITEYYSDEEDGSKEKKGNKNFLESALAATGLGAAVKSLTGGGGDDDKRSDTRSRRGGSPDSRASSPGRTRSANKMQKAAMASLLAGATEAFRVSKEPGGWKGEKTKRILTAAAGAATVDAAQKDDHGKMGLMESVLGGLVGNRLINGSKNNIEEDRRTGRSRSRSRAGSSGGGGATGLAALATAGLGAFGAKKALESRSRSRGRRDSYDSRSPTPDRHRRQRSRSRSVVDKARNSLAKLGIGSGAAGAGALAAHEGRRDHDDYDDRGSRRPRRYSDEYDDDRSYYTSRSDNRDRDRPRDYDRDRDYDRPRSRGGRSDHGSETDLGDSSEDEKRAKKMKGKLVLTTGLAAVATIHAAHGVYQSMEKRSARQKAVKEGRLSPAEAKKLKTKAIMQDAASVGIAALGIKGAVGELKEAREISKECRDFKKEKAIRHEKRLERRRQASAPGSRRRADSWDSYPRSPYDEYDTDDDYGPRYYDENPYGAARLPAPLASRGRQGTT